MCLPGAGKADRLHKAGAQGLTAWVTFFEHWKEESTMSQLAYPPVQQALEMLKDLSADDETQRKAFVRERALRDEIPQLASARMEGFQEGFPERLQAVGPGFVERLQSLVGYANKNANQRRAAIAQLAFDVIAQGPGHLTPHPSAVPRAARNTQPPAAWRAPRVACYRCAPCTACKCPPPQASPATLPSPPARAPARPASGRRQCLRISMVVFQGSYR